jgi:hypothetical protein
MMKAIALLVGPALAAAHGNMLYPPAWWDANGTSEHALLLHERAIGMPLNSSTPSPSPN